MLHISKNKLHHLYLVKKLDSVEIAKIFNCNKMTILRKLHEHNIKIRPGGSKVKINRATLENLYLKDRKSTWKIAEILGYSRSTIYQHLIKLGIKPRDVSSSHILYKRKKFSGNEVEKSYIVGFAIGDLRVRKSGKEGKTIKVDCASTKKAQIKLIESLFKRYGRVWKSKLFGGGKIQIEAFLDDSFSFLLNSREYLNHIFNEDRMFWPFFAGFVDAEGCIHISNNRPHLLIGNYDVELLIKIRKKLIYMGLPIRPLTKDNKLRVNSGGYVRKNYYWTLRVDRRDSLNFLFKILIKYIKHAKRISDMKKAMSMISKN